MALEGRVTPQLTSETALHVPWHNLCVCTQDSGLGKAFKAGPRRSGLEE